MELTWLVVDNPTSAPKIKALAQKIKTKMAKKKKAAKKPKKKSRRV